MLHDNSNASIYLIAGKSPSIYSFSAPFTIQSDGVVPVSSALGIEPITGKSLGRKDSFTLNLNHLELQKNPQVAKKVVEWLNKKETDE